MNHPYQLILVFGIMNLNFESSSLYVSLYRRICGMQMLVYWTDYYLSLILSRFEKKNECINGIVFIILCLLLNILTCVHIIRELTGFYILKFLPSMSRYSIISWIIALSIELFCGIALYNKYFAPLKLSAIKQRYKSKNMRRIRIESILYIAYVVITWSGFFVAIECLKK